VSYEVTVVEIESGLDPDSIVPVATPIVNYSIPGGN